MTEVVGSSRKRQDANQSWKYDSRTNKRLKVEEGGVTSLKFLSALGNAYAEPFPMVISDNIIGYLVKHTLIDQGSSVDVLYYVAFSKMGGMHLDLQPSSQTVVSFNGEEVQVTGIIVESPYGIFVEKAIRFSFKTSNKQAEYEAMLARLELAQELEAERVQVYNDSQKSELGISHDIKTKRQTLSKLMNTKTTWGFNKKSQPIMPRAPNKALIKRHPLNSKPIRPRAPIKALAKRHQQKSPPIRLRAPPKSLSNKAIFRTTILSRPQHNGSKIIKTTIKKQKIKRNAKDKARHQEQRKIIKR
ncbi:Pro-Pol polyprotein [Senna tora]|uniref:Pro-Pol polyprotein n=1 Tax=Senna tora TaxID=362788 RepID=A0A834X015_9FABA|nr:Pro-Pol polyprotein [Senna tora]